MNSKLAQLHDYPFQKLARLLKGIDPDPTHSPIALSVGEPKHASPEFVLQAMRDNLDGLSVYPTTRGLPVLREAIARWLQQRFGLTNLPDSETQILPVSGTREALFSVTQAIVNASPDTRPVVIMPNPFYQIYEGAALLAGAEPYYLNTTAENDFIPDLDSVPETVWQRTQLMFYCSPGNPTGKEFGADVIKTLMDYALKYNFVLAADECYSEIYFDEQNPPAGLLEVAQTHGNSDYHNCLVFHSLSKRSNLPGLRSGFVAGDADILKDYFQYRTYHGATLSNTAQLASVAAWQDEEHVKQNRQLYKQKFDEVIGILSPVLPVQQPDASFYLWPEVPWGDETCARELYEQQNIKVLPGSYLSREANGINPGRNRVRMALVATPEECADAAKRIRNYIEQRAG
ncbi:MAG: succinyldiaminopimelate transaminase [Acidiferrobacterales bacterium]|nr:succinyldiaminopimelate transaminase [Acidiferrobacterales bacterium]